MVIDDNYSGKKTNFQEADHDLQPFVSTDG